MSDDPDAGVVAAEVVEEVVGKAVEVAAVQASMSFGFALPDRLTAKAPRCAEPSKPRFEGLAGFAGALKRGEIFLLGAMGGGQRLGER